MAVYNFKSIHVVPSADDFVDITLSKTQRKTPTIIHRHFAITRIREFYTRKVKFTQQNFSDKLKEILADFPILDELHPFYEALCNILYDRDHYKLALGQLNTCRSLIEHISNDYVRLLKYGDSMYRCKQLKRAAMGRMCTLVRKQANALAYLEEVRQHMARLPWIDPSMPTILICGYPNVGKSSFLNKVTHADVEVQPYAFTTKSLLVGHTDHSYRRFQVVDTPGILDGPLEERNTIEMLSVTALAHLRAAVLFVMDVSGMGDYTIEKQLQLFNSIRPLFAQRPVVIGLNKIDQCPIELLDARDRALLNALEADGVPLLPMSTLHEINVSDVKARVCDMLSAMRVSERLPSAMNRPDVMNRLHVAVPQPRDHRSRPAFIPESVLKSKNRTSEDEEDDDLVMDTSARSDSAAPDSYSQKARARAAKRNNDWHNRWLKADEDPDWDPTIFGPDVRDQYDLKDEQWKYDVIPEIVDGLNVADFVDPAIMRKLLLLEREEEALLEQELQGAAMDTLGATPEQLIELDEMDAARDQAQMVSRMKHIRNSGMKTQKVRANQLTVADFREHMEEMGIDPTKAVARIRQDSKRRENSRTRVADKLRMASDRDKAVATMKANRQKSLSMPAEQDQKKALRLKKHGQKRMVKDSRMGEADRHVYDEKPAHLFQGKRGIGKTDRR